MISGAIFLDRDVPVEKLFGKYVSRLFVSYLVWAMIYALLEGGSLSDIALKVT